MFLSDIEHKEYPGRNEMLKKLSLLICAFFWVFSLHAAPITWVLEDVSFDDGGIAIGSFVFDADSNTVLDWDIIVSGGDEGVFPVFSYTPATVMEVGVFTAGSGQSLQFFVDPNAPGNTPESRLLGLTTDASLTNSGGSVSLLTQVSTPQGIFESVECYNCTPFRLIVSGTLNAVPVPASVWLFGAGLIGLIGVARRKVQA
jgi:hypothetical protein